MHKPGTTHVVIRLYGDEHHFDMERNGTTLLEAAEIHGIVIDTQCRAGICGTCRCKLVRGRVDLIENWILDESELAAGYTLACCGIPQSDHVVLEYEIQTN